MQPLRGFEFETPVLEHAEKDTLLIMDLDKLNYNSISVVWILLKARANIVTSQLPQAYYIETRTARDWPNPFDINGVRFNKVDLCNK